MALLQLDYWLQQRRFQQTNAATTGGSVYAADVHNGEKGQRNMATPFKQIAFPELPPIVNIVSDQGGWTTDHAAWLRRPGNAALVRQFMDERMVAEATQQEADRIVIMDSGYTGPYATERTKGPYRMYPAGWQTKSALDRAAILKLHFPTLDFSHVEALVERYYVSDGSGEHVGNYRTQANGGRSLVLPESVDSGLIVFPKLEAVVRLVKKPPTSWKPLNIAMGYLLDVLKEVSPGFYDYTERKVGPEYEKLLSTTEEALLLLDAKTPGDVLVLPAQTGALFAGYNVRSSRGHMSALTRHIPLHDFGGGCFALTDPERFTNEALWMDCPGTERAPSADGDFWGAPCWGFSVRLRFSSGDVGHRSPNCGSASFILLPE